MRHSGKYILLMILLLKTLSLDFTIRVASLMGTYLAKVKVLFYTHILI